MELDSSPSSPRPSAVPQPAEKSPLLLNFKACDFTAIKTPDGSCFAAPTVLLIKESKYFAAALAGNFNESKDGEVILEESVGEDVMSLIIRWIYCHDIRPYETLKIGCHSCQHLEYDLDALRWNTLVNLWIMADYLQMDGLKTHTMYVLCNKANKKQSFVDIEPSIWNRIHEASPLARFLRNLIITPNRTFSDALLQAAPAGSVMKMLLSLKDKHDYFTEEMDETRLRFERERETQAEESLKSLIEDMTLACEYILNPKLNSEGGNFADSDSLETMSSEASDSEEDCSLEDGY